jgi:transposase-like protein
MYSYEDRIRAVRLYLDLGKRGAATVRQLGYPTARALSRWHQQYERGHDLPSGYVSLRPKYSAEEKQTAVDHYLDHGQCLAWTLKALGYPERGTLASWVDELRPESRKRIVGKVGSLPQPRETKEAAVIELCMRENSARVIAQRVGVSRPTLYNWKNELLGREVPTTMKCHNDPPLASERKPWKGKSSLFSVTSSSCSWNTTS